MSPKLLLPNFFYGILFFRAQTSCTLDDKRGASSVIVKDRDSPGFVQLFTCPVEAFDFARRLILSSHDVFGIELVIWFEGSIS